MTKTYSFYADMTFSYEIEVEADNYDEAWDLAMEEANDFAVSHPEGYTINFDGVDLVDHRIPEED